MPTFAKAARCAHEESAKAGLSACTTHASRLTEPIDHLQRRASSSAVRRATQPSHSAVSSLTHLQARAVLAEGGLHLQLLLNGRVRQLRAVALHLGGRPEGALQPARRVFHVLQLPLQPLELRLTLPRSVGCIRVSASEAPHNRGETGLNCSTSACIPIHGILWRGAYSD